MLVDLRLEDDARSMSYIDQAAIPNEYRVVTASDCRTVADAARNIGMNERTTDVPNELISAIYAAVTVLVAAKSFLSKQQHRLVVRESHRNERGGGGNMLQMIENSSAGA